MKCMLNIVTGVTLNPGIRINLLKDIYFIIKFYEAFEPYCKA